RRRFRSGRRRSLWSPTLTAPTGHGTLRNRAVARHIQLQGRLARLSSGGGEPMANIKSAMKRNRQNEKRRVRNAAVRSTVRTSYRSARVAIEGGRADQARAALLSTIQTLDKAVTKGVIHKNTAARKKSRLARQLNALATR